MVFSRIFGNFKCTQCGILKNCVFTKTPFSLLCRNCSRTLQKDNDQCTEPAEKRRRENESEKCTNEKCPNKLSKSNQFTLPDSNKLVCCKCYKSYLKKEFMKVLNEETGLSTSNSPSKPIFSPVPNRFLPPETSKDQKIDNDSKSHKAIVKTSNSMEREKDSAKLTPIIASSSLINVSFLELSTKSYSKTGKGSSPVSVSKKRCEDVKKPPEDKSAKDSGKLENSVSASASSITKREIPSSSGKLDEDSDIEILSYTKTAKKSVIGQISGVSSIKKGFEKTKEPVMTGTKKKLSSSQVSGASVLKKGPGDVKEPVTTAEKSQILTISKTAVKSASSKTVPPLEITNEDDAIEKRPDSKSPDKTVKKSCPVLKPQKHSEAKMGSGKSEGLEKVKNPVSATRSSTPKVSIAAPATKLNKYNEESKGSQRKTVKKDDAIETRTCSSSDPVSKPSESMNRDSGKSEKSEIIKNTEQAITSLTAKVSIASPASENTEISKKSDSKTAKKSKINSSQVSTNGVAKPATTRPSTSISKKVLATEFHKTVNDDVTASKCTKSSLEMIQTPGKDDQKVEKFQETSKNISKLAPKTSADKNLEVTIPHFKKKWSIDKEKIDDVTGAKSAELVIKEPTPQLDMAKKLWKNQNKDKTLELHVEKNDAIVVKDKVKDGHEISKKLDSKNEDILQNKKSFHPKTLEEVSDDKHSATVESPTWPKFLKNLLKVEMNNCRKSDEEASSSSKKISSKKSTHPKKMCLRSRTLKFRNKKSKSEVEKLKKRNHDRDRMLHEKMKKSFQPVESLRKSKRIARKNSIETDAASDDIEEPFILLDSNSENPDDNYVIVCSDETEISEEQFKNLKDDVEFDKVENDKLEDCLNSNSTPVVQTVTFDRPPPSCDLPCNVEPVDSCQKSSKIVTKKSSNRELEPSAPLSSNPGNPSIEPKLPVATINAGVRKYVPIMPRVIQAVTLDMPPPRRPIPPFHRYSQPVKSSKKSRKVTEPRVLSSSRRPVATNDAIFRPVELIIGNRIENNALEIHNPNYCNPTPIQAVTFDLSPSYIHPSWFNNPPEHGGAQGQYQNLHFDSSSEFMNQTQNPLLMDPADIGQFQHSCSRSEFMKCQNQYRNPEEPAMKSGDISDMPVLTPACIDEQIIIEDLTSSSTHQQSPENTLPAFMDQDPWLSSVSTTKNDAKSLYTDKLISIFCSDEDPNFDSFLQSPVCQAQPSSTLNQDSPWTWDNQFHIPSDDVILETPSNLPFETPTTLLEANISPLDNV